MAEIADWSFQCNKCKCFKLIVKKGEAENLGDKERYGKRIAIKTIFKTEFVSV